MIPMILMVATVAAFVVYFMWVLSKIEGEVNFLKGRVEKMMACMSASQPHQQGINIVGRDVGGGGGEDEDEDEEEEDEFEDEEDEDEDEDEEDDCILEEDEEEAAGNGKKRAAPAPPAAKVTASVRWATPLIAVDTPQQHGAHPPSCVITATEAVVVDKKSAAAAIKKDEQAHPATVHHDEKKSAAAATAKSAAAESSGEGEAEFPNNASGLAKLRHKMRALKLSSKGTHEELMERLKHAEKS
jgi:hypothetical protein